TPDLRMVVSTAGYLEEILWRNFEARAKVKVVNVYGLTETVAGGLFSGPDEATRRIGTLGRPVDCQARIMDLEGRDVGEGESGELWLQGANQMRGYLGDPEATNEVLREGWLHTGDLARRDSEGFFHFAGRLKNVLVSGGHTVQPEEITAALKSHPGVAEAATIGMAHAELEEVAVSAVVPAAGAALDETTLVEHCREKLAAYKVPRRIVILKSLPYGPSGKVQVDALRAIIATVHAPDGSDGEEDRVLEIARRTFKSQIGLTPASVPETTPGWDSMAHLEFVLALEDAFGIHLSSHDIMNLTSLAAAIEIVEAARHG
ncbi:MAG TPA: AMP-binding protein, partial [Dongiaceae bacterium]|nr:AMP-binding protein [Dongiaceae bacterium]